MVNLGICKPQYPNILSSHKRIPPAVTFQAIWLKVTASIQFYDKLGGCAVKIRNIGPKGLLSAEVIRMWA